MHVRTGRITKRRDITGGMSLVVQVKGKPIGEVGDYVELRFADDRLITPRQRNTIYSLLRDIAYFTGYTENESKAVMKEQFQEWRNAPPFSLSDCSRELASQFIDYLLEYCIGWGVVMSNAIEIRTEYTSRMLYYCLKFRKCAICGDHAEIHHWDAIGMSRDRRTVDDSNLRKIALCRKHHTVAHAMGREAFGKLYIVYGIVCREVKIDEPYCGDGGGAPDAIQAVKESPRFDG
jgi:hypothetical protein